MSNNRYGTSTKTQPAKPTVTTNRAIRATATPKLAEQPNSYSTPDSAKKGSGVRTEPAKTPTLRKREDAARARGTPEGTSATPRSPKRIIRTDGRESTPQAEEKANLRPRSAITQANRAAGSNTTASHSRQLSNAANGRAASPLLVPASGNTIAPRTTRADSIESRFFHADDAAKQDFGPRKPELSKASTFFYANGQSAGERKSPPQTSQVQGSAVLSSLEAIGRRMSAALNANDSAGSPKISPALSTSSSSPSYFVKTSTNFGKPRSPSPIKDHVHLSYRKGVSQIFGMRPLPIPRSDLSPLASERRSSMTSSLGSGSHRKSFSLSSVDSAGSHRSRTESSTAQQPLIKDVPVPLPSLASRLVKVPVNLPSIDTSLESPAIPTLSPTKNAADLAADARRERKVLDLEISNSSLLAINASLERELRKQKAELKSYRRLTRAGRFSLAVGREGLSDPAGLSALDGEGFEDLDEDYFGRQSTSTDMYDGNSDDDLDSMTSGGDALSPDAPHKDRLARDEKKLALDFAKHKELLVQSQAMNQSLKRCMLAAEDMIKEGKKALQYHVRVSDVKLGGKILTGHEDSETETSEAAAATTAVAPEDDYIEDDERPRENDATEQARAFLEKWAAMDAIDGSEGGDRDSGIELERPTLQ